ncbi:hypothetical protein OO013_16960 [Mangrovivirga sp. M17]|uniref:DUF304 domain-containing protein n=1 Tax=Mangrovivirga halotolerans TaxID=2993936 RepID=A0ABT3RUX8_9BACT|nr:hypothetical protein [Mangrovivirga halotolerans]MCX2745574.1 hypothetical protein [Mangrovivirga halotolerans]
MFKIDIESSKIEDLQSVTTTLGLEEVLKASEDKIIIQEKKLSAFTIVLGSILMVAPWIWLFNNTDPELSMVVLISLFTIIDLWVILNNILSNRSISIDLNYKVIVIERKSLLGRLIKPKTVIPFSEFSTIKKEAKSYDGNRPVFRLYMNTENHNFSMLNVTGDNESDTVKDLMKDIIRNV